MRRAFVTGGSGFVGGRVIERLREEGVEVRALARSPEAERAVAERGAEAIPGGLDDTVAIDAGLEGADVCVHAAAALGAWGDRSYFERVNVDGTRAVAEACARAGARLVHVSTEAVLLAGRPLVMADETAPLRPDSPSIYAATKAQAEQVALSIPGADAVAVRPRLVWGPGDRTILPALVKRIAEGKFAWVGGGRHLTSTTHVDNVAEGIFLAAQKGRAGRAYFVSDGDPVPFRDFVTELVRTQGVDPPERSVPRTLARLGAVAAEGIWGLLRLRGEPPVTRFEAWASSQEQTVDITRAREELGYEPVMTVAEGLRALAAAP